MPVDEARRAAYARAYELFEAVQGEDHAEAAAAVPTALAAADGQGWTDVAFVLAGAQAVYSIVRPVSPAHTAQTVASLLGRAESRGGSAATALALGLRAVAVSPGEDGAALMADASRAVALLDDESDPAVDRCTGYVVAAAAFNSLRLWELVDELYGRATDLEPECEAPAQAAAIAVNRILTRLEWSLGLLEIGHEDRARALWQQVIDAVPDAMAQHLPDLWRTDVEACGAAADLLLTGRSADEAVHRLRAGLVAGGDIEVLPLLDAAVALAHWRGGRDAEAVAAARRLAATSSASSGACTFPLWVRAQIFAGRSPAEEMRAQQEHATLLTQLRWNSRQAVLAAARAHIAAERGRGEHDRLTRAVNTDPLTGVHNRRLFDTWLHHSPQTRQGPAALLLVDIDAFKTVNDSFGHDCGDEVLRRFGALLLASVRPGDLAVRLGGDEFAVVLDGGHLTEATARQRAKDLQTAIESEDWSRISAGLTLSASMGLAVAAGADPGAVDPLALYRAADDRLYAAKRDGTGLVTAPSTGLTPTGR